MLSVGDNRSFVLLIQLARKRELDEVTRLMLPPLSLEQAIVHVQKQVSMHAGGKWGGGYE